MSQTRQEFSSSALAESSLTLRITWAVRVMAAIGGGIGAVLFVAWMIGAGAKWSAAGFITVKTNMAVAQLLGGLSLLLLAGGEQGRWQRRTALAAASCVLLIGGLTLLEHASGINLGIDQLLAREAPGAAATTSPNRMGLPGSTSLVLIGAGLFCLAQRRPLAAYLGLAVCGIAMLPLIGFLYRIEEFYSRARVTGIAWPSVAVLMSFGTGLVMASRNSGLMSMLLRKDAGGALFRRWLPLVIVVPIALGYLRVRGQQFGFYDTEFGTGLLTLALVLVFFVMHWQSAARLSRAQEVIRERSEQFESLLNQAPLGVYLVDADFRIRQVNPVAAPVFAGIGPLAGRDFSEVIHLLWTREYADEIVSIFRHTLQTGETYEELERAEYRVDRQRTEYYEWRVDRILLPEGRHGVVCYFRDISAQVKARERIGESEERLRLALEASGGGAWGWDVANQRLDQWDTKYLEFYGFAREEPITFDTWLARVHVEDRERLTRRVHQILDTPGDDVWDEEFRVMHPVRGERCVGSLGRCYRDADGKALRVAGVNLDITERRAAQEVLRRSKEELEILVAERTAKLQELVGELEHLSYTITHDMRAPLRAMRGFAEIMSEECAQGSSERQTEFLKRIITAAERMDGLITDALNYSKAVRQDLPLAPVDPGKLLRGMLDSYPEFQSSNATIFLDRDLPLVLGNEAGLTQCFSNLLGNAVKFAGAGRKPEVRVSSEVRDGWVRLWVTDNGIGISEALLPRVFDMFARGTSPQAGTGIGLALVRKVVHRMGGKVGVQSEVGKGSRFWIELRSGKLRRRPIAAPDRSGD